MLPRISWPEVVSAPEVARVQAEIITELKRHLKPVPEDQRVYALVFTPTLTPQAEARFLSAAQADRPTPQDPVRIVDLPRRGRCYSCTTEEVFAALLPLAFQFGPPEVTLIAANLVGHSRGDLHSLSSFLRAQLRKEACDPESGNGTARDSVGMHFDSGDLVEMF
jgi:hypothetical protein